MDTPILINDHDVENSGWTPPTDADRSALVTMQGALKLDLDAVLSQPPQDTFLWLALHSVLRRYHNDPNYVWRPQFQRFGTCVGQANKLALDILAALNAMFFGVEFKGRFAVAGTYTFSRVEVAHQPGKWQGSNGYQAVAGNMKFGCLLLKTLGLADDARDEDEQLALEWTASKEGVPAKYEQVAGDILVADAVTLKPEDTLLAAKLIQCGAVQIVGTTFIPTGKRDADGISPCARSRGGHEMCIDGVRWRGSDPIFHLQNSWDTWGSGGIFPVAGTFGTMPPGGVWITSKDYSIMRADADSTAMVGMNGLILGGR